MARVLSDLGRLANRETPSVLSLLVLEDIAMALYLAHPCRGALEGKPLAGAGGSGSRIGRSAHHLVSRLSRWRWSRTTPGAPDDEQVLLRMLGLTLLVAGVAQGVGASSAVGAFWWGSRCLNKSRNALASCSARCEISLPRCSFVSFGLATVPADMIPMLLPALGLALVGIVTKAATGWFAATRDGVGRLGRLRAGLALGSRGEFSIMIPGLAVSAGVSVVGPLATAYVMMLAVAGPILTRFADQISSKLATIRRPGSAGTGSATPTR